MTGDEGSGPMMTHDEVSAALGAYALDAVDAAERKAVEAHLASCLTCTRELAELRGVTVGIGMTAPPEQPPASLRARTLARALLGAHASSPVSPRPAPPSRLPWLLAAASMAAAVGLGTYAAALRTELVSVRELAEVASARVDALRAELLALRQDAARLQRAVTVVSAPDLQQVRVAGLGAAEGAGGLAFWSRANGLVFNARQLPPLEPDRGYELWVIPPGASPVSVGMLVVSGEGTASHWTALPANLALDTVAVTIEQAGGSPTGAPQGPIVMAGKIAS